MKASLSLSETDVNKPNNIGWTPVHIISVKGYVLILEMLIKNNAQFDTLDNDGFTPLPLAAIRGHVNVVQRLLNTDEGISSMNLDKTEDGSSPLLAAVINNDVEVVRVLLNYDETDVNQANKEGWTPV